jgi:plasmid stabilization system protein ParE
MKLEIRWSPNSEITFDAIYHFILEQWSFEIAEELRLKIYNVLDKISIHPFLFQESPILNVRKEVISKYTSLFYEVFENHIFLVFFWDNRQQPFLLNQ